MNNNTQGKATVLFKLVGGTVKSPAFRCTFQLEALYLVIVPTFLCSFFFQSSNVFSFNVVVRYSRLRITKCSTRHCVSLYILNAPACAITEVYLILNFLCRHAIRLFGMKLWAGTVMTTAASFVSGG